MASSKSIGSLTLDLLLKMGGFISSATQAQRQLDKTFKNMKRSADDFAQGFTDTLKNAAGAIGLAFSFDKFIDGIKEAINYTAQMADEAAKVGTSVEGFSSLNYAASLAGISTDTLSSAMGSLTKNLAATKNPLSEQARLIQALQIPKEDANDTVKFLSDFADKFKQLGGDQTAIQAGMALFGKNFKDLIPLLKDGSTAIGDARDEAKDLGVVVGQDAADAAQQFNQDITRLKAVCQGWFIQISQSLLPLLDEWSGDAVQLGKDHEDLGDKTQVLIKTLYALLAVGDALAGGFRVIGATVSTVVIAIGNAARNASALYDAFSKQDFSLNPVTNFKSSLSAWKQFYQTFNSNNQAARDTVSDLWSSASDGMQKDYEALKGNIAKIADDIPKVFPKVAANKAAGDFISNIYGDPDKNAADAKKIKDAVNGILSDPTGANAKQQAAQVQALANAYAALQKKIEDLNGAANPDQRAYSDLVSDLISISQASAAIIKNGGDVAQTQKMVAEAIEAAQQKYAKALAAPMNAAKAYNAALQAQFAAQKNLLDVNVKTMTMGDREAANYKQLAQDAADAAKAVTDFENAHQQHPNAMTDEQYKTELAGLEEYLADRHQLLIDSQQQEAQVQSDFNAGLQKGMADFIEQMKDKFSQGKQFIQDFTSGFSDAFEQWASGAESAKKAFGDFIDSLFADALKFVANQAISKFFQYLGILGGNGSGDVALGTSAVSSGGSGNWFSSLLGAIFGGGKAGGGPVAAGTLYRVNEQNPELLTVGGQDFLMMGKQGGYVTPNPGQSRDPRGNTFIFNLQPTSTRQTAEQVATATSRKLRVAQARNG